MSQDQLLFDSFQKRRDLFARELRGIELGSVEALHRTRVASRRLRELVPLLPLDRARTRKLNRRLRNVTKRLGTVRELDVLAGLIDQLKCAGRFSPVALARLSESFEPTRDAARERLAAKLPTEKLRRLVETLDRVTDCTNRRWVSVLDERLAHRATVARTAIERAGALYAREPLHDVRIALKKLRYSAELRLEAGGRSRLAADVNALKKAQDLLGRLHDREVLIEWTRQTQTSLVPLDIIMWRELRSLVHAVEDDCRRMHGRYMRDRPGLIAVADRLGAERIRIASKDDLQRHLHLA